MYSLWLLPAAPLFEELEQQIKCTAERFGSPSFLPHLTLISRIEGEKEELFKLYKALGNKLLPLAAWVLGFATEMEYFRALYYQVASNEELQNARNLAQEAFQIVPHKPYNPHLSLLYGDFDKEEKQRYLSDLQVVFPFEIVFDRLWLVDTSGKVEDWQ